MCFYVIICSAIKKRMNQGYLFNGFKTNRVNVAIDFINILKPIN